MVAPPPRLVECPAGPSSFHNGTWFFAANSGGAWTVIATDRIPQPVLAVRNPRDDYTTAAPRQKEALAKQWGSDWFSPSS